MSELLALGAVVAGIMMYYGVGLLALAIYDRVTDGNVRDREEAAEIVCGWPVIAFIAVAGLYAMWATQRELEKLGGER